MVSPSRAVTRISIANNDLVYIDDDDKPAADEQEA
jgi:hypothetical protein